MNSVRKLALYTAIIIVFCFGCGSSDDNNDSPGGGVTIPSAPSLLSATVISSTQLSLAWTDNANNEEGFKIERKTGASGTFAVIATVTTASYQNTGLTADTTYYYRVYAYNSAGNSNYSEEANANTLVLSDSFETGSIGQRPTAWNTTTGDSRWTDGVISTAFAHTGTQSVLLQGAQYSGIQIPWTWTKTGIYEISAWFFVPAGSEGTQHDISLSGVGLGCISFGFFLRDLPTAEAFVDYWPDSYAGQTGTYTADSWHIMRIQLNFDATTMSVFAGPNEAGLIEVVNLSPLILDPARVCAIELTASSNGSPVYLDDVIIDHL